MKTKRIAETILTALCIIVVVVIVVSCDQNREMMHGNISMGRDHWNWGQILISLSIGLIGGFLLGHYSARRK